MRTRWQAGGNVRDHLALWCSPAVLALHVDRLRHHATGRTANDDPLRRLLLRPLRGRGHRRQLGDVGHQALGTC